MVNKKKRAPSLVEKPAGCRNYRYQFSVPGLPRQRGNTRLENKAAAHAYTLAMREQLRKKVAARGQGREGLRPIDMAVKHAVAKFYANVLRHKDRADAEEAEYGTILELLGPETMMSEIDDQALLTFRSAMIDRGYPSQGKTKLRRSYKNSSVNHYLRQIRRLHRHARAVLKLPLDEINWKSLMLSEGKQRTREYTYEEERRLFYDTDDGNAICGRFMIMSSFRKMNFTQLRWSEIHVERDEIELENTKINNKPYVIPQTDEMRTLIEAQRGYHAEFVFTYVAKTTRLNPKTGAKIINGVRYPVTYSGFTTWFKRRCVKLGIKGVTIHDGRRTGGGRILDLTGDLTLVQSALQLSSLDITRKHYAHTRRHKLRNALNDVATISAQKRLDIDQIMGAG